MEYARARVLGGYDPEADDLPADTTAPEVCFHCGTVLVDGDCPACMARWAEERAAGEAVNDSVG